MERESGRFARRRAVPLDSQAAGNMSGWPCHANFRWPCASWRSRIRFSGRRGGSPRPERFLSEDAERAAGRQMALDVESVLDRGMNG